MKKVNLLLYAAFLLLAGNSFGQITSIDWFESHDSTICDNYVYVYVLGGTTPENGAILTLDWGDGNTSVDTFDLSVQYGQYYRHTYSQPGIYTTSLSVWSTMSNAPVNVPANPETLEIDAVTPGDCGLIYLRTRDVTEQINYFQATYDFTDVNGITTTITPAPDLSYYGFYLGLNVANGPYTVGLNETWLATHGLIQADPNFTINFADDYSQADPSSMVTHVTCATTSTAPDFGISYAYAYNLIAPLQIGYARLIICNYACTDISDARVTLTLPAEAIPDLDGLTNPVFSGNTLTFDVNGLETCAEQIIRFNFPGATPAGTPFNFNASVAGISETDNNPANNSVDFIGTVLNSYDPNDKSCNKPTFIDPTVAEELQYVIRFQNDGNLAAYNIVVRDTISALLDLSTLEIVGSKHNMTHSVNPTTRIVTFTFTDIQLAPSDEDLDASQGYLVYKIKENENLPVGSEIKNTAYIYFDFNPAIITNTTSNINVDPLGVDELSQIEVRIFPNPASSQLNIQAEDLQVVSILDCAGKTVLTSGNQSNINTSALSNGMYLLQVTTAHGKAIQKLIIQK
jgi:uncharacterized repeat protein (TIGR01451 family)